jgi:hypothetical protein
VAGRVLHVECCAPATATAMATASATAATTDTASNRHPSRRQDQPPAKKNCVANWLQWLPLRCCFWLLPPTTALRPLLRLWLVTRLANKITAPANCQLLRLLPHILQLQLLQITGATNPSSRLLLRLLLRLRLLKRHPSRQQDHPHRQMATTGRNGSATFRLLLPVAAAAAAAATASASASATASAPETSPFSPTRSPTSPDGYALLAAMALLLSGCCFQLLLRLLLRLLLLLLLRLLLRLRLRLLTHRQDHRRQQLHRRLVLLHPTAAAAAIACFFRNNTNVKNKTGNVHVHFA